MSYHPTPPGFGPMPGQGPSRGAPGGPVRRADAPPPGTPRQMPPAQAQTPQHTQAPVPAQTQTPVPPQRNAPGRQDAPVAARYDPAALHVTESTRTYPCPGCGGVLGFDPTEQAMKCPSCGNVVPLSSNAPPGLPPKHDLAATMQQLAALQVSSATQVSDEKEIVCQSCGGHTAFSGTLTTLRCPYCNTSIQRDDVHQAPTRLAVDAVLPLQIGSNRANTEIVQWINSRWFAPNAFKKYRDVGSFTSVYLPYFGYDAATTTDYKGSRGIHRTESYTNSKGETQTRTVTDWYPASGRVDNTFNDVTGHANTGLDDKRVTELEPWPMELARPFNPEYLAGHLSRTYDQDASQVFSGRVQPRMESIIDTTIRRDIGGDEQRIYSRNTIWHMVAFAQLLLPVWMLAVTYKNKPFNVLVNGVTGEVQGQRPWSAIKITLLVIAILAVLVLIYYLVEGS